MLHAWVHGASVGARLGAPLPREARPSSAVAPAPAIAVESHPVTAEPVLPPAAGDAHAETTALLIRRLRTAVFLCIIPIVGFAVLDVVLAPAHLALLWTIKAVAIAVAIAAYVVLPRVRRRASVIAIALIGVAVMHAVSASSAIVTHDPDTTPIISIAAALAMATLLPWGVVPQLAMVAIALLSCVVAVVGSTGSGWPLLEYANLGALIGLGVSVYVAHVLARSRAELVARQAEQRQAQDEVRRLNEQLEARVAARTAELEHLARALQAQITERAEAETETRRSEATLAALIEYANDAIWSIDRTQRVTALNAVARQGYLRLFGVAPPIGRPQDPDAAAFIDRYWRPLYERGLAGERFTIEHAFDTPAGRSHHRTFFNPIVADGAVTGLAIFSADITDRLRADAAESQHRAELAHVLRLSTMGEMAAGLAHEINQPLAAIVNYARGCSRRLRADPGGIEAVLAVIDDISAEALRAGEIIRRLRNLVRKEPPRQEWVQMAEVAAEALRLAESEAHQQRVVLRLDAEPALPRVLGDPIQMEQVVFNLLRNAIDAMLDVRGRREVHVRIARAGGASIELSVRDTGHGMPADVAERVFDAFYSTKPHGLGMGLSISRSIIEAHHGRITVVAHPEGGTTFRIVLPVAADAARATAATG